MPKDIENIKNLPEKIDDTKYLKQVPEGFEVVKTFMGTTMIFEPGDQFTGTYHQSRIVEIDGEPRNIHDFLQDGEIVSIWGCADLDRAFIPQGDYKAKAKEGDEVFLTYLGKIKCKVSVERNGKKVKQMGVVNKYIIAVKKLTKRP